MLDACRKYAKGSDLFIATAAVSDFSFKEKSAEKLKRGDTKQMRVELTANPDIVASVAEMNDRPTHVIAFAAESSDHVEHAREKLTGKGVDAIFANDVSNMGSAYTNGFWITAKQTSEISALPKEKLAEKIIEQIMELQK